MKDKYNKINRSYNKKFIFHIGCSAGFFSEYNNMVFAIAYCLKHKIQFQLFSKDANFAIDKGWTDYFQLFCEEKNDDFHSVINRRQKYPSIKTIIKSLFLKLFYKREYVPWLLDGYKFETFKFKIMESHYKRKHKFDYYTFELWKKFRKYDPYINPKILKDTVNTEIYNGTYEGLFKLIISLTWKYNFKTQLKIDQLIKELGLSNKYIGMHIRGGDKIKEDTVFDHSRYFDILNNYILLKDINSIFLLTDDYEIYNEVVKEYPQYKFSTFCDPTEKGYDNSKFYSNSVIDKSKKLIQLFASIEILYQSEIFIGVYNSNPGMFLDMRRSRDNLWVDR